MDDEQLIISRFIQGDESAFRIIYENYFPKVLKFSRGFVKDADTAEDIAQSIFVRLWEKRALFTEVRDMDAYIYRMTRNEVLSYMRLFLSRYDMSADTDLSNRPDSSDPHNDLIASDLRLLIDMTVVAMPPQRRAIFRMSREEGLDNQEIADRLNIKKKTVENHLNLALRTLRHVIGLYASAITSLSTLFQLALGATAFFAVYIA